MRDATPPVRSAADLPPVDDWRTTDQDEITRRRLRAQAESPRVENRDERYPIFSNFDVHSQSGVTYLVEIRDLTRRQFSCECVDFRVNGLGTCKHVEAVPGSFGKPFLPGLCGGAGPGLTPGRSGARPQRPGASCRAQPGATASSVAAAVRRGRSHAGWLPARDGHRIVERVSTAGITYFPGSRALARMSAA